MRPLPVVVVGLFNAHFNSRVWSGVGPRRSDDAHHYQIVKSANYLSRVYDGRTPIIYGWDFNTASASKRLDRLNAENDLKIAHQESIRDLENCEVLLSAGGDEPLLDTQDLQLFENGQR